ncbi:MAG: hypothetical protein AAGE01_18745 [Pseudomonadota bacterium]
MTDAGFGNRVATLPRRLLGNSPDLDDLAINSADEIFVSGYATGGDVVFRFDPATEAYATVAFLPTKASGAVPLDFNGADELHVLERSNRRIVKILSLTPEGASSPVVPVIGGDFNEGRPARHAAAGIVNFRLQLLSDGAILYSDIQSGRLRQIGADGRLTTTLISAQDPVQGGDGSLFSCGSSGDTFFDFLAFSEGSWWPILDGTTLDGSQLQCRFAFEALGRIFAFARDRNRTNTRVLEIDVEQRSARTVFVMPDEPEGASDTQIEDFDGERFLGFDTTGVFTSVGEDQIEYVVTAERAGNVLPVFGSDNEIYLRSNGNSLSEFPVVSRVAPDGSLEPFIVDSRFFAGRKGDAIAIDFFFNVSLITEEGVFGDRGGFPGVPSQILRLDSDGAVEILVGDIDYGFGESVALDSDTVAVAAPELEGGTVFVYDTSVDSPRIVQKIMAPPGFEGRRFGASIALSGQRLAVGAPADGDRAKGLALGGIGAAIFERNLANGFDYKFGVDAGSAEAFGSALSMEGDVMSVGDPQAAGSGQVYVFSLGATAATLMDTIAPSIGTVSNFGASLDYASGKLAIGGSDGLGIGAGTGVVDLYEQVAENLQLVGTVSLDDDMLAFGASVAIDGDTMFVGAPSSSSDPGSVFVFDAASLQQLSEIFQIEAGFGTAVDATDGLLVVGAPARDFGEDGAVYSYTDGVFSAPAAILSQAGASIGSSVSTDGSMVLGGDGTAFENQGLGLLEETGRSLPGTATLVLQPQAQLCLSSDDGGQSAELELVAGGEDLEVVSVAVEAGLAAAVEVTVPSVPFLGTRALTINFPSAPSAGVYPVNVALTFSTGEQVTRVAFVGVFEEIDGAVSPLAPIAGRTVTFPAELVWTETVQASAYRLEVSSTRDFENVLLAEVVEGTRFTIRRPLSDGSLFWRVTPLNDCYVGPSSSIGAFSIGGSESPPPDVIFAGGFEPGSEGVE